MIRPLTVFRLCMNTLLYGFLLLSVNAFDIHADDNLVNYWGQNSYGATGGDTRFWQKPLADYCQTSDGEDVLVLAFLHVFNSASRGLPRIDFSNQCNPSSVFPGTSLLHCPQTGTGVKVCQSKGKAVILSLGGAAGAYGFSDDAEAKDFAHTIWNLFLGGSSSTRPLDDAVLDGVDLDIEGGPTAGYPAFIQELRSLFATDPTKRYYISAAPQCPYPDAYLGAALQSAWVDMVFVQYYNNYCGVQVFGSLNFNFEQWDTWAKTVSINKAVRVYLGVPASQRAANAGYVTSERLREIMIAVRCKYSSFGGIMMWDVSQAYGNYDSSGSQYSIAAARHLKRSRSEVCYWTIRQCASGTYCTSRGCDFINGPVKSCRELEQETRSTGATSQQMNSAVDRMWGAFGNGLDSTWLSFLGTGDGHAPDVHAQHAFETPLAIDNAGITLSGLSDESEPFLIDFVELDARKEFVGFELDPNDLNTTAWRTQVRIRTNGEAISPLWRVSFNVEPGEVIYKTSRGSFIQDDLRVTVTSNPRQEAERNMVVRFVMEGVASRGSFEASGLPDPARATFQTIRMLDLA
ncbi:Chitinase 1 [Mortierella sp. GBA30]|nr:Chitinase 1 [Mortierella sp. GBA30]